MTVESKEGRGGRWWRHKGKMGRIRWWKGKRIVKVGDIAFRTVWGPGIISLWHLHYPKNMGGVGAKKGISIIQCLTFFPQLALPSPTFFLENLFLYCIAIYIGCSGNGSVTKHLPFMWDHYFTPQCCLTHRIRSWQSPTQPETLSHTATRYTRTLQPAA